MYPRLRITDSTITSADGLKFSLQGDFDLSDKENYVKQFKSLSFLPLVKRTDSEAEWTIKSNKEENGVTELKFIKRRPYNSNDADEESGLFGLGRTIKF